MAELSKSEIAETLRKFLVLPNEYKGLSFDTAFRNEIHCSGERKAPAWNPLSANRSHAFGRAVCGSTIFAQVRLFDMEDDDITVFAVGKTAIAVLDAPSGATVRVRAKTVFGEVPSLDTVDLVWEERRYDKIQGVVIEKILGIDDPPEH